MKQVLDFSNLNIEITETSNEVIYSFTGDVDENFRQKEVPRIKKEKVILELEHVVNFNSCGIREWIYFIRDISEMGSLVFRKCSVTMIDQINMVPDSLGSGVIESFYAPYYCSNHGESNQLINAKDTWQTLLQKTAPNFKCEKCKNALEFDALEESYFLFTESDFKNVS